MKKLILCVTFSLMSINICIADDPNNPVTINVTFSLMSINTCIADDPNNPVTINYNSYEARIKELEDKIIELENRIAELESQRPAPATRSPGLPSPTMNDPNKDALRLERGTKEVQKCLTFITLYEAQLKKLPTCYHLPFPDVNELKILPHYYYYYYYYSWIHYHFMSLDEEYNWALDNIELLRYIEDEYKKIDNCAKINPELNIDRIDISKKQIELRSELVGFDKVKDDVQKRAPKGHRFLRSRCYERIPESKVRALSENN